ncbi:cardioacceleratory peptide receptor-like isoform X2 [Paramacrobiotus metropolitanus]|uniref:cardioacceleratory peptide receptor-like isoform X2 n=1 Tax=Paramacrobiotus metropolitanus TaxID=2943436 RepID=UPI002445B5BC|nr:cardioacceleratory peptide receptor-like isoform X2 [Paramacrobiotus metropolitanus]
MHLFTLGCKKLRRFHLTTTEQLTFMFILAFLVISFNFLVFAALGISKTRTRMGFWVLHLALADLLVGLISIPTDIVWQMTYEWYAGNVGCKAIRYAQVVVTFASNYVLVALSIDRYDAIANPLTFTSAVRRSRFLIGSAWFFSFLFSIPMLFLYEQDRIDGYLQCWISFPSQTYWQLYFTLVSLILFIIPVIIIIACFAIVLRTIYVRGRNLEFEEAMNLSRQDSFEAQDLVGSVLYRSKRLAAGIPSIASSRSEFAKGLIPRAKIKTTKMALVIVTVFIACWSPYCIYDLLDVYEHVEFANPQTKIAVSTLMQSLAPLNSVANPVISCIYLRREIVRGLRRIHRTLRQRGRKPTSTTQLRFSRKTFGRTVDNGWTDNCLAVPNNSRNSNSLGDEGSSNGNALAAYSHVNGLTMKGSRGALV